ncbi:hypothetical protein [Tenacibaculum agarivorans]|uniref:hypothetical protein n=1 Tax=Tenacibaculum agarivorans TaxID=1908389 RepID=UPI00094BA170|nr:hypothetical protein [Tenacibaculum agarivorans]
MFNFFKRTKVQDWELELLNRITSEIPKEFNYLNKQVNSSLFRSVILGASDIPGYIAFGYNYDIYEKFSDKKTNYKLTGIKVYNNSTNEYLNCVIYVTDNVINGYSLDKKKKYDLDLDKIDYSNFNKTLGNNSDYERFLSVLNSNEKNIITASDVYLVTIQGKEIFHIKDLEDGDFIGMDMHRNIYQVNHDPLELIPINKEIVDVI